MLNRYFALLKKDIITGVRNYYFVVVIAVAIIFALIVNFLVPEDTSIKPAIFYHVEYQGDMRENIDEIIMESEREHPNVNRVNSREEIIENMKKKDNSIGMFVTESNGKPVIEFITQGYENKKVINTLVLSMKNSINESLGRKIDVKTNILNKDVEMERIPFNKSILPIFLLTEPTMLGFVLILALVFMEKDEGTIRAYMVSPGRIQEYLASKITLMIILGLISTIVCTGIVVGFNANYLALFGLVIVGSIFSSALGLIIASFFDNLSQSFIWVAAINILFALPMVSYLLPSFAPTYIKILPTYPLLFAIREAVFPTGNVEIIYSTILTFIVLSIMTFIVSVFSYKITAARD
ncbi:ABC transporter permease [Thermohalobacter berrensis]|uniref:ABC-2 type transporter transmembrane domain-containing protein n=1 Tax=Thermohalobacter berrensis TaxID=99594 RepID=A0A419T603_9FIRM|nr:ABC transporter permease [Thermohalobacter berrensis]RKD32974.1 hypothetical protein BET03_10185 [Thermohalobacter berrensis]